MARYKPVERGGMFIPVVLSEQIQPGTFEFPSTIWSTMSWTSRGLMPASTTIRPAPARMTPG